MQQLTYIKPGVLEWHEVAQPTLQGASEAIVRPLAIARCDLDAAILFGKAPVPGPFPIGHEFIAEIVAFGEAVTNLRIGQRVIVPFQISCGKCRPCLRGVTGSCASVPPGSMYGLGTSRGSWGGALSDLVRIPFAESMLVALPDGVEPAAVASLSDNVVDGWRTVGPYLEQTPGASVLIVGGGAWSVGLYAAAIAVALGAGQVDYLDVNPQRLALAQAVGANPVEGKPPKKLGSYAITVDASADPAGLDCALRSVEPEGICTSVGIYFGDHTPIPLNEMYYNGIVFKTGRVNSRAGIPAVLNLVERGLLYPERLTTRLANWQVAAEALLDPSPKVVITR